MIKAYVLGFAIDPQLDLWLSVFKEKGPPCNIGKWNGIGGKVEAPEFVQDAMDREFKEETKLELDWQYVGEFTDNSSWRVSVFRTIVNSTIVDVPPHNDIGEQLAWRDRQFDPDSTAYNLEWILPMVFSRSVSRFTIGEVD